MLDSFRVAALVVRVLLPFPVSATLAAATQFITNMNAAGYLGQTNWELPPTGPSCNGYNCSAADDPMAKLFSSQLGFSEGPAITNVQNAATFLTALAPSTYG